MFKPTVLSFYSIFFKILLAVIVFFTVLLAIKTFNTYAFSVTTTVLVGNESPSFTVQPFEDPASSTTTPTNVGLDITFKATGTDSNEDNYYLIICSTDSVNPVNGAAPTCGANTWCTSLSTLSGTEASCSRTALVGDPISNIWYAFVCDGNSSAQCSSSSQGSGESGSPFVVNHAPTFTAVSNDDGSGVDPGSTVTWSATASDSDSDTLKLLVCKTTGISGDTCDGGVNDTWCSSSLVASNPSCSYTVPSVYPDDTYSAYVYIVDEHNSPATGVYQGSNVSFTVNNVAPTLSALTLNGGINIDLLESTTKEVIFTASVTDNNSCFGGEIDSVIGYAYRSSIGYTDCDTLAEANNNNCYPEITCSVVGDSCTDITDGSATYTCTANIHYYADPTDIATQYPDDTWLSTIKGIDDDTLQNSLEVSTGVEMNSLTAFSVTNSINFGSLSVEQSNNPLDKITITTPTGNVGLDQELSGSEYMCTDYPTCSVGTPIPVINQKYSLTSLTPYSSATVLSTTPTETEINIPKVITGTPTTKNTWWGILVPTGTGAGTYYGNINVTGIKAETIDW
jgi:hypothetical protein